MAVGYQRGWRVAVTKDGSVTWRRAFPMTATPPPTRLRGRPGVLRFPRLGVGDSLRPVGQLLTLARNARDKFMGQAGVSRPRLSVFSREGSPGHSRADASEEGVRSVISTRLASASVAHRGVRRRLYGGLSAFTRAPFLPPSPACNRPFPPLPQGPPSVGASRN